MSSWNWKNRQIILLDIVLQLCIKLCLQQFISFVSFSLQWIRYSVIATKLKMSWATASNYDKIFSRDSKTFYLSVVYFTFSSKFCCHYHSLGAHVWGSCKRENEGGEETGARAGNLTHSDFHPSLLAGSIRSPVALNNKKRLLPHPSFKFDTVNERQKILIHWRFTWRELNL